ncbi:MAG: DUF1501 domain-containing protein [Candidatus Binatia bacterium]|nr:DUF1501 domain-containing protein [Candidatus Binatia bacterium]
MKVSRRRFLQGATAGAVLGPTLFNHALVRKSLANTIGNRYLVVVLLDGGNDGLNTITPIDDGAATLRQAYDAHRNTGNGGVNLPSGNLLPVGADPNSGASLGLHPSLQGLHDLHTSKGTVAFIQGCGYPDASLSHDVSRSIWETANPLGVPLVGGWVGRHLAGCYGPTDVPAVVVDYGLPGDFRQTTTSVLAIKKLEDFGFPYDYYDGGDVAAKRAAFDAIYSAASGSAQSQFDFIGNSGAATLVSSEAYPPLHDLYETDRAAWSAQYSAIGRSFAEDLREVAKMIYGVEQGVPDVNARYFECNNGGYDTHSGQGADEPGGRHGELHAEVGDSLKVFYEDLEDMGVIDDVAILVWSEFSRRIQQNSNGTDHGSQGPMLLLGGDVKGGVFGNHPNINDVALNNNGNTVYSQSATDPFRSTDFRDIYGSVLKQWAGMPHNDILTMMPLDTAAPASNYWTVEDFDLDLFLP